MSNGRTTRISSNVTDIATNITKTQLNIISNDLKNHNLSKSLASHLGCSDGYDKWSWKSIKEEFKAKDSDRLFQKYQSRLQHTFFIALLLLNIMFDVIAIIVYFCDKDNKNLFPGPAIMRIASLMVFIMFFIFTFCDEQLFRPRLSRTIAAVTILAAMTFAEYGGALFAMSGDQKTYSLQRIRPTFYLIMANHILLPFPSRIFSCISTLIIIAIEIMLTYHQRVGMNCKSDGILKFEITDVIFYLYSGLFGFYMTYLLEIANRKAFMNHRACVESTVKSDYEQEQQEQLLNTCIPQHLIEIVRTDIREVICKIANQEIISPRPFNKLFVEPHKDVSILFADIVNSMLLTASLSPNDLVETLNELFGRFDDSARRNNCVRIKLLGDCYYCVSGLPNTNPDHAINCVRMGLDMIKIIGSVREDRDINVNMRIGVHSGMVLSGVIGLHKWQYDIWSLDTIIANNMEHHGVAGKVHITKVTYDLIPPEKRTDLIIEKRINDDEENENMKVTFLVEKRTNKHIRSGSGSPRTKTKRQTEALKEQINKLRRRSSFEPMRLSRRQTVLESSLRKYREMIAFVNRFMDDAIDEMPLSNRAQWTNNEGIHPFFFYFMPSVITSGERQLFDGVKFSTWILEKQYAKQWDPLFSFYLLCSGAVCITMMAIKLITPQMPLIQAQNVTFMVTLAIIIISIMYTYYKRHKLSIILRIIIWLLISILLLLCSMMDLIVKGCSEPAGIELVRCAYSWYYTLCIILAMTGVSCFIRINLWLKFTMHIIGITIYIILSLNPCSVYELLIQKSLIEHNWMSNIGLSPRIGHIYYVLMVGVLLHFVDRQVEYIFRLDFQWNNRLEGERIEAQTMEEINRRLLSNILPIHVAQRYLNNSSAADQLYHESYDSCAVMFASIPNYARIYDENIVGGDGRQCLQILNEIICDFDRLLSHVNFHRIEKIKTIGSTYMAAAGLQPGRGSTESSASSEDVTCNVVTIVRFASALMETLQKFNKNAFQDYKLRVGIAVGPVIAGVVGAGKPQYDIWGDIVNVASRMESTGINGRIQVTAEAAEILANCEISKEFIIEPRGLVMVKGKGELNTFLIKTQFDFDENEIINY